MWERSELYCDGCQRVIDRDAEGKWIRICSLSSVRIGLAPSMREREAISFDFHGVVCAALFFEGIVKSDA